VWSMMTLNLHWCYLGIFDGLPIAELAGYRSFIDAHARHEPPIETVYDFEDHTLDVLAMFQGNDFAREYAEMSARDPTRFPAVPARLSSAGIADGLRAMKATITVLGGEVVTAEIQRLWDAYGERPLTGDPDAVYRLIRQYLCLRRGRPRGICLPDTRPPVRADTVYRLLARLRGQA
jgi:hypothetical protein